MDLNDGRFQDNGGCGYVLKPAVLMFSQRNFDPGCSQHSLKPTHLLLKVLSMKEQAQNNPSSFTEGGVMLQECECVSAPQIFLVASG